MNLGRPSRNLELPSSLGSSVPTWIEAAGLEESVEGVALQHEHW